MHHGEYEWNHDFPRIAREAGFKFCEFQNENIDWKFIGSLDIEKIIREREFDRLDHAIPYISQAPLDELLNSRILDPAISKYFGFAQLSVQYLLFCKQFLDQTVAGIRSATFESQKENSRLQRILKRRNDELLHLQKKQQQKQIVYSCTKCTKNFSTYELLNKHISNKHSEDLNLEKPTVSVIDTNQLEIEIKQLKERLNVAEKALNEQRDKGLKCDCCDNKSKDVQSIGIQSNLEEAKDKDESEEKVDQAELNKNELTDLLNSQMVMFEEWKNSERKIYTDEISGLKKKLEETIEEFKSNSKVVLEKCVEANLIVSPRPDEIQVEMELKREQEENLWKKRFSELEKMYENNQQKMNSTIKGLDDKYKDNMMKIEETVRKESLQRTERFEEEIRRISIKHLEPEVKVITPQGPHINAEVENHVKAKIGLLGRSTTFDQQSTGSDSQTEYSSDDEASQELKYESKIQSSKPPLVIAPRKLGKSAQPEVKRSNTTERKITEVPVEDPKNFVKRLIKSRFSIFGVESSVKTLQTKDMDKITKKLAVKRESSLKKFKTFYILRNQLTTKMDKLTNEKLDKKDTNKILSFEIKKPKLFPTVIKSKPVLPREEIKLNPNDFSIETIIEKPERDNFSHQKLPIGYQEVVDIESEVNTLLSSLNRKKPTEIETSTPIKEGIPKEFAVNHKTVVSNTNGEESSEISEINDFVPKKPQPVPRKRVLFDLEKNRFENRPKANESLREEEASDFDISSFNSDK